MSSPAPGDENNIIPDGEHEQFDDPMEGDGEAEVGEGQGNDIPAEPMDDSSEEGEEDEEELRKVTEGFIVDEDEEEEDDEEEERRKRRKRRKRHHRRRKLKSTRFLIKI